MQKLLDTSWRYLRVIVPAIAVWYATAVIVDNPIILPTPVNVAQALWSMILDGTIAEATAVSMGRLVIGYCITAAVGVPLGIMMGLSPIIRDLIDPVVEILRPISGIAWIPLALVLFGIGDDLVLFIIIYGAAFPIILNTVAGVREVDKTLVFAARTFGVSQASILTQIMLPAALPTIFVGLRIGLGTAWMSLVAAELIGAGSGLGYLLTFARQLLMSSEMLAGIVVIGLLGLLTGGLLIALQKLVAPWSIKEGVQ